MIVCKRVHYSGRVQGVGFRYTTQSLAQGFAVAGSVRNLPDGNVELVAEGEAGEVDRFLNAVANRMAAHIDRKYVTEISPERHQGFRILH